MGCWLWISQVIFAYTASLWVISGAVPASDPCTGTTCGTGAECRFRSNLVVCLCPEGTEGDPFDACKFLSSTTDATTTGSTAGTNFHLGEATTQVHDILKLSPKLKLSPTISDSGGNSYAPEGQNGDDLTAYFPSAPPTLSHYAHAPPFSNAIPPRPTEHQYPQHHHGRDRLHNSFQGNINHDFKSEGEQPSNHPSGVESPNKQFNNTENGFNIPDNDRIRIQPPRPEQSHRHGGLGQFQPHPAQVPTNHPNGPNRIRPPQFPFNNQNHPPTHFNLKQENLNQIPQQRQELAKDPLGIYIDCLTINNRVVCADTSSRHDLHPSHLAPQWNQGFEHRLIAVGNENKNTFHMPPSITRPDAILSPNPTKVKPGQHHHLRPLEERPHFQQPGHHQPGPPGMVNLFPAASSAEVQSDVIKISQETHVLQPHPPQQQIFHETKPYAPQPGTEEAKLCQQMCGEGSVCRVFQNRAICGCPEGHTGDPAKKCFLEMNSKFDPNSCQRHIECPSTMICLNSQCTDPCLIKNTFNTSNISSFHDSLDAAKNKNENMCGPNSKCSVIEHTQLCSCEQNYYGNPYIGCVQ